MLVTSEELVREMDKMEIEVKIPVQAKEWIYEIQVQPDILEKIQRCQETMMMENNQIEMTGKEVMFQKDEKGFKRFASRI